MNLPLYISRRLSFRADGRRQRSPGVAIAVAGVATAITVMMLTLAVVIGFRHAIRDKVTGFDSQISISVFQTDDEFSDKLFEPTADMIEGIKVAAGMESEISTRLTTTGVLKTDNDFAGLMFRSFSAGSRPLEFIEQNIVEGSMPRFSADAERDSVVVSKTTANTLKLSVGDRPMVYFVGPDGVRQRRVTVAAIYDTSFSERDKLMAFVAPSFLEKVAHVPAGTASEIVVDNLDFNELESARRSIQTGLNKLYGDRKIPQVMQVTDVRTTGAAYFNWLDLLDTNVVVIILLMSVVAAFTLISSLFILILERVGFVGLLKAMGASNRLVGRVFVYLALRIVGLGLLIGNIVGLGLIAIQYFYRLIPLNPDAYYLSYVPVELNWMPVVLLNVGAIVVSWLVLILPTIIISGISPASTMRYE